MMHRNLDRRVEALVRLTEPAHLAEIDRIFEVDMSDTTSSWWLDRSGIWEHHSRAEDGSLLADSQDVFMREISSRRRIGMLR
jgi:polyphosphate kinase